MHIDYVINKSDSHIREVMALHDLTDVTIAATSPQMSVKYL